MTKRRFPILDQQHLPPQLRLKLPRFVDWDVVETYERAIERNHDQTLETLAERGGLAPEEIFAAAHGLRVSAIRTIDKQRALDWLYDVSGEPRE